MKLIDWYLGKQLLLALFMVVLLLFGLELFFGFIQEMKWVGRGTYTFPLALSYLLMIAPTKIYQLLPWAACLGTLIGLGALSESSELTVMRAAGVSVYRIAWSSLKSVFLFAILAFVLGESIAPYLEEYASAQRTSAISGGQTLQTPYGVWTRQGSTFIHVQSIQPDDVLRGVTRYQFNHARELEEVSFAEQASPLPADQTTLPGSSTAWRLRNIQETRFLNKKTTVHRYPERILPVLLEPELLKTSGLKHPEYLSLKALWKTIQDRQQHGLEAGAYWLAWWSKCLHPVAILVMAFLSIPFVFGRLRRSHLGQRLILGFFLGFLFFTANKTFAPLAMVYQSPPLIAVLSPIVLFAGLGCWLMKRVRYQ